LTAIRVSGQPERLDVLRPNLLVDEVDELSQMPVVVIRAPRSFHGRRRGDDEPVLILEVDERKVVPVPVAVHTCAMETEDERHGLAGLQIARIVEEERAIAFREHGVSAMSEEFVGAIGIETVEWRGRDARRPVDSDRLRVRERR
jgi:hypothetical protein